MQRCAPCNLHNMVRNITDKAIRVRLTRIDLEGNRMMYMREKWLAHDVKCILDKVCAMMREGCTILYYNHTITFHRGSFYAKIDLMSSYWMRYDSILITYLKELI